MDSTKTWEGECDFAATVFNLLHERTGRCPEIGRIRYPYTAKSIWEYSPTGELYTTIEIINVAHALVDAKEVEVQA